MIVPIDNCSCCLLERAGSLNAAISTRGIQTFALYLNYAKLSWSKGNEFFHFYISFSCVSFIYLFQQRNYLCRTIVNFLVRVRSETWGT